MRALIIGASGQVGKRLLGVAASRGVAHSGTARKRSTPRLLALDIQDRAAVKKTISSESPTVVFLCAALTAVDYCESHPDEARRVNVDGVQNVADACRDINATLVFLSTDYVFNGRGGPYGEDHPPSPESVYGKTKLEGERIVLDLPKSIVARTSVVHDWDPGSLNFVMQMIKRLGEYQPSNIVSDQWSHPTLARNLADMLWELADRDLFGLYNVVGPDYLSRFDFTVMLARTFGFDASLLTPITTASLGQAAPRPLQADLKLDKLRAVVKTPLIGAQAGLELIRKDYRAAVAA
jgi:dTDP-4-dehydrorhamnose reductase